MSLREGAGKGVWSGREARKVCPGYSFVTILSPPKPPKKKARGGLQKRPGGGGRPPQKGGSRRPPKGVRGRGSGEGGDRGRRFHEGHGRLRKRFGRARKAIKVCPGYSFVQFAARCLFSRAGSRVLRGSQKVQKRLSFQLFFKFFKSHATQRGGSRWSAAQRGPA